MTVFNTRWDVFYCGKKVRSIYSSCYPSAAWEKARELYPAPYVETSLKVSLAPAPRDKATRDTLATLDVADIKKIDLMIAAGYGAQGIRLETPYTLKQINAVFKLN
jgi:hypothetical protein